LGVSNEGFRRGQTGGARKKKKEISWSQAIADGSLKAL